MQVLPIGIARLATVMALALLLGCNMLPGGVTDLNVGDCFDLPADASEMTEVQHRPCNEPHDAEVIAVLTHPAAPGEAYPVISGFGDYIDENCVPAFETYTGRSLSGETELAVGYLQPTLLGWGDGDRGFTCHVSRNDEQKMTSSVRVSP